MTERTTPQNSFRVNLMETIFWVKGRCMCHWARERAGICPLPDAGFDGGLGFG